MLRGGRNIMITTLSFLTLCSIGYMFLPETRGLLPEDFIIRAAAGLVAVFSGKRAIESFNRLKANGFRL